MIEDAANPGFLLGLGQIVVVNILLSGDNAVVIALAARSLHPKQQKQAIIWGSVAAIVMRVILTIVAVELLRIPYLKIAGGLLLFWVAVQLLMPEHQGGEGVASSGSVLLAVRTILIADLVMSLDNVIAVAAAARGDIVLLILGLAIGITLIIYGSTALLKLMTRYPVIITAGAALLGWVAAEMLTTDPAIEGWVHENLPWLDVQLPLWGGFSLEQLLGAVSVIVAGKLLAKRKRALNTALTKE